MVHVEKTSSQGFTLLEVIVTVVLLGFLIAGLAQASRLGAFAAGRQARMEDARSDLDAVYRTLRALIESARPGSESEKLAFVGTDHAVAFTSRSPRPYEAGSTGHADVRLSVDSEHRLVLAWAPHLHATRVRPAPPVTAAPLLDGVAQVELAYWPSPQGGWVRAWNDEKPPRLVRVRIVFSDAERAAWPDLIAASKLDTP